MSDKNTGETVSEARKEGLLQEIEELKAKLAEAETSNERLQLSLDLQEKTLDAKNPDRLIPREGKIEVGMSFNPDNIMDQVAAPYKKADPGSQFRYISTHPTVYPLRRGQGYTPVKDSEGNEVKLTDAVLAKMPRRQYEQEILGPRNAKKGNRLQELAEHFHEEGSQYPGIKTTGTIKYDDGGTT